MNENQDPFGGVMKGLGICALSIVGVGVFIFSAANNFNLFLGIFGYEFGGYVLAGLGLTILDIAAVGWVVFGVSAARGVPQRVVALGIGGICLTMALSAAISELVIKQSYTERPDWIGTLAIVSIIVGLIVNGAGIPITHIIDAKTKLAIRVGMKRDAMQADLANTHLEFLSASVREVKARMNEERPALVDALATEMFKDAKKELLGYTPDGDNSASSLDGPRLPSRPIRASDWSMANIAASGISDSARRSSPLRYNSIHSNQGDGMKPKVTTALEESEDYRDDSEVQPEHKSSAQGELPKEAAAHMPRRPNPTIRPFPTPAEVAQHMSRTGQ